MKLQITVEKLQRSDNQQNRNDDRKALSSEFDKPSYNDEIV